jgi:RHH-type transcriptional regulator, rel operon repressor / antitoxin RelB
MGGPRMTERFLTLSVAEETAAGLERLARATGRSADRLAEEALQRYLDFESWKTDKITRAIACADAGEFATDEELDEAFDRYRHAAQDAE